MKSVEGCRILPISQALSEESCKKFSDFVDSPQIDLKVCRILGGGMLSSVKRYEIEKVLRDIPTFSTFPGWVGKRVILCESLASYVGFCDPSKHVVEPFVETWGLVVNHARSQAKSQTIRHHLCRIFMLRGLLQKADLF
jgi:hypothetical protein